MGAPIGTCSSRGDAIGCWRLGTGEVDLTRTPVWTPKSGKQSLELNNLGVDMSMFNVDAVSITAI